MEHTLLDGARWIAGVPFCYEPESAFFGETYRNHVVMGAFELESVPARAELELAVLGYARVRINGKRAGWLRAPRMVDQLHQKGLCAQGRRGGPFA